MQYNPAIICSYFCLVAMVSAPWTSGGQLIQISSEDKFVEPNPQILQPDPLTRLSERPKVIVLSLGGLKKLYVDSELTPNLDSFYKTYATAKYMKPVFPSKTSVNLLSIATGLYAEKHGVIYNCRFDEALFNSCEYEQYNQELNPIWIENQINGGISGVLNWPGSNQEYQGRTPIHQIGPEEKCEDPLMKMIDWLEHETQPANLVMAYFDEIDKIIHYDDPEANSVRNEIKRMDALVKKFIDLLEKKQIKQHIDIIIIGTQGTHGGKYDNGIDIKKDILKNYPMAFKSMGANAIISPKTDIEHDNISKYLKMKEYDENKELRYRFYKHDKIPDQWHLKGLPLFKDNDIFLVANEGYFFWSDYLLAVLERRWPKFQLIAGEAVYHIDEIEFGIDGYDNEKVSMKTLFIGMGPHFKLSTQVEDFYTIDIYPLLRKFLQLESNDQPKTPLNESVRELLRDPVFTPMEKIEETDSVLTPMEKIEKTNTFRIKKKKKSTFISKFFSILKRN